MGRHSRGVVERRGKQALAIAAAAGSEGLGVALISWGNHLSAENYYYDVVPWGFWGAVFIALPVIAPAIVVVAGITRAVATEHRRYREWKAALTPEQRAAVGLAEAAALTAAAIAMWEHHKRVDARLTSSVMGRTMPDGHDAAIGQDRFLPPAGGTAPPGPGAGMGSAGSDVGQPGGDSTEPPLSARIP
jgi:hypothetical protein